MCLAYSAHGSEPADADRRHSAPRQEDSHRPVSAPRTGSAAREPDALEQELLVVVVARLAAGALRRPRVRRGDGLARRRRREEGAPAPRTVDPGPLSLARG